MDAEETIDEPRQAISSFHLKTAISWREVGETDLKHTPLAYAAFELRCAIERVAFELYHLLKDAGLTAEEASAIGSFRALLSLIHTHAGGGGRELYLLLKFNKIYVEEMFPVEKPVALPDVSTLQKQWSKLSEYCHRQLVPEETWQSDDWLRSGYELLHEVENYLLELLRDHTFGFVETDSIPGDARDLREQFLSGAIDEESLRIRLMIAKPVIETRPPWLHD